MKRSAESHPLRHVSQGSLVLVTALTRLVLVASCVTASLPVALARPAAPIVPVPSPRGIDRDRAALGEQLFGDVRLSRSGTYSCATCHPLDQGGTDGLPVATIVPEGAPPRNTPTIFNAALNGSFNWDGVTDAARRPHEPS